MLSCWKEAIQWVLVLLAFVTVVTAMYMQCICIPCYILRSCVCPTICHMLTFYSIKTTECIITQRILLDSLETLCYDTKDHGEKLMGSAPGGCQIPLKQDHLYLLTNNLTYIRNGTKHGQNYYGRWIPSHRYCFHMATLDVYERP